jgi:hypothetical protein
MIMFEYWSNDYSLKQIWVIIILILWGLNNPIQKIYQKARDVLIPLELQTIWIFGKGDACW